MTREKTMPCNNCGKEVPGEGRVCPFCHVDKSHYQKKNVYVGALIGGIIGVLGGSAGSFNGSMIGLFLGVVLGAIIGRTTIVSPLETDIATSRQPADMVTKPKPSSPILDQEEEAMLASGKYKYCPDCAEVIRMRAKLCRFCGHTFPEMDVAPVAVSSFNPAWHDGTPTRVAQTDTDAERQKAIQTLRGD